MSVAEEIKRLHELHQAGALSDEEFAQAKARLLQQPPAGGYGGGDAPGQSLNRLRRSQNDRWLGGVCGGLAAATGLDSWIWRLIFLLAVLSVGVGIGIYLLLWIFVPEEELIGN
jgi:phage shock protein PspC (stress-responsive transcriptional regulator)